MGAPPGGFGGAGAAAGGGAGPGRRGGRGVLPYVGGAVLLAALGFGGYKAYNSYQAGQAEQAQQEKADQDKANADAEARRKAYWNGAEGQMRTALTNGITVTERYVLPRNISSDGKTPGIPSYELVLKDSTGKEYSFPLANIREAYNWVNVILPGDTVKLDEEEAARWAALHGAEKKRKDAQGNDVVVAKQGETLALEVYHAKTPHVPVGQTLVVKNPELIQVSQLNGPVSELVATLFAESVPYLPGTQTLQLTDGMSSEQIAEAQRNAAAETRKYQTAYMIKVTFSNPADQERIVANLRKGYIFRIREQDGSDSIVKVENDNGREVYYVPSSRIVMEDGQVYDNSAITARKPIKLTREAPKPAAPKRDSVAERLNSYDKRIGGVENKVGSMDSQMGELIKDYRATSARAEQADAEFLKSLTRLDDNFLDFVGEQRETNKAYKSGIDSLNSSVSGLGTDLGTIRTQTENLKEINRLFRVAKYGKGQEKKDAEKKLKALGAKQ